MVLGEREEALGRDWLLPVAQAMTTRDICHMVSETIGQPVQILNVPTVEQAQERGIFDEAFVREYAELFYQYTEPQIVDSSAFGQAFGLQTTPLDEAIRSTIRWYREYTRIIE